MQIESIADIRSALSQPAQATSLDKDFESQDLKPAAVLILIYPGAEELELVLTRRCDHLPHHAGQISLPGGRIEPQDVDHVATAIREAEEEIGLNSQSLEVIGSLETVSLPSGFSVAPVVATLEAAQPFLAAPEEVAEIIPLPLSMALDLEQYKRDSYIRNGFKRSFYYIEYKEYYIWGATAGILYSMAFRLQQLVKA